MVFLANKPLYMQAQFLMHIIHNVLYEKKITEGMTKEEKKNWANNCDSKSLD